MKIPKGFLVKPNVADFHLGSNSPIQFKAVEPSGNWSSNLLWQENQDIEWETDGCVCFTTQESFDAQIDNLIAQKQIPQSFLNWLTQNNYMDLASDGLPHFHSSARFLEIMTGNGINGNSAPDAWNAIRKYGVAPWRDLPYDSTITQAEYFVPVSQAILQKAATFLSMIGGKGSVNYHWLTDDQPKNMTLMQQQLPQAPLCIGIAVTDAWNQPTPQDPPPGQPPQHCVLVYAMGNGSCDVLDHYAPYDKVLDSTYAIPFVLQGIVSPVFSTVPSPVPPLPPNSTVPQEQSWLSAVAAWLQSILNSLKGRDLSSIKMSNSSVWIEFLKKTAYVVGGLVVASFVSFLNANPTLFGSVTAIVAGILSMLEAQFWPSVTVASANQQIAQQQALGVAPVIKK